MALHRPTLRAWARRSSTASAFWARGQSFGKGSACAALAAASVWMAACVGLATGMGYYALAFIATVMSLIVLVAFDGIQQRLRTRHRPEMIQLNTKPWGCDELNSTGRPIIFLSRCSTFLSAGRSIIHIWSASALTSQIRILKGRGFTGAFAAVPGILRMENHQDAS